MRSRAFGLSLRFDGETPPGAWTRQAGREREVVVRAAPRSTIEAAWSGFESLGWEARIDGLPFVVERGIRADYRFRHGAGVVCHLDAEGATLLHAAGEDAVAGWRTVLDSVIFSVALLHGLEALHAGAVVSGDGAIAIAAATGGGKSTLLASLLANGFELLADDVVALETDGELVLGHPGPPLMTVPAAAPSLPGEELAVIGAERWLATPVSPEPRPLTAVVLLNRRAGAELALRPLPKPLFTLLAMMLRFPRTPDRERSRFELAATIAMSVPVWELRAEPTVPPAVLAELLAGPGLRDGRAATNLRRT